MVSSAQTGTAFSVIQNGHEYFITAKHVIPDAKEMLHISNDGKWLELPVTGVYPHPTSDITVFTLATPILGSTDIPLTMDEMSLGEPSLILGFPFGWAPDYGLSNGYPTPFVKAAIVSAAYTDGKVGSIYLDGHNNPGFSGGPIIIEIQNKEQIIGVVSGYPYDWTPPPSTAGLIIDGLPVADDHIHPVNSGFILGYDIKYAVEIIEANPHGALVH